MSASRRASTSASSTRKRSSPSDVSADALARIRARGHIGIRLGLGRMRALLARAGRSTAVAPWCAHRRHQRQGQRGRHGQLGAGSRRATRPASSPSPHLHSYRERVTIDGQPIDAAELDALLEEVLAASDARRGRVRAGDRVRAADCGGLPAGGPLRGGRDGHGGRARWTTRRLQHVGPGRGGRDARGSRPPGVPGSHHRVGRDREGGHHQARRPCRHWGRRRRAGGDSRPRGRGGRVAHGVPAPAGQGHGSARSHPPA